MSKIYSTLGRKFNKKDLEEAQRMSEEIVKNFQYFLSPNIMKFNRLIIQGKPSKSTG